MNLLVDIFEGCNEEIIVKETKGIGSVVKWGENAITKRVVTEEGYLKIL